MAKDWQGEEGQIKNTTGWSNRRLVLFLAVISVVLVSVNIGTKRWNGNTKTISRSSSNDPHLKQAVQLFNKPMVTVMGADALNKGYNLYRGRGADPGAAKAIVQLTIKEGKTMEYGDTVYFQPDQMDLTMNARCNSHYASEQAFALYSSAQAKSLARESAFSVDASVSGSYMGASGGVSSSAAFGNSDSMKTAQKRSGSKFGSASRSYVQTTLYNAFIDWDHPGFVVEVEMKTQLDKMQRISKVGGESSFKASVYFFERFGSHVIAEGAYGSKCSMTTFLDKTETADEVAAELAYQKSSRVAMNVWGEYSGWGATVKGSAGFEKSEKEAGSSSTSRKSRSGKEVSSTDVTCTGYVEDNLCNRKFDAKSDNPAMVSYRVLPIWDATGILARKKYKRTIDHLVWAHRFMMGRVKKCGDCVISESFWNDAAVMRGYETSQIGNWKRHFELSLKKLNKKGPIYSGKPSQVIKGHSCGGRQCPCGIKDLAVGRPTGQVSIDYSGASARAVDGNLNQHYNGKSCSHTKKQNGAWWYVDIGANQNPICAVKIWNRNDCCQDQLDYFDVFVTNTVPSGQHWKPGREEICATNNGRINVQHFSCKKALRGRYVGVWVTRDTYLTLCEVQVFSQVHAQSKPTNQMRCIHKNVALARTAREVSLGWGGIASRAVDGNMDQNYNSGRSCTHTKKQNGAWWYVDIGANKNAVCAVKIWNRRDCCSDQLDHFVVFVTNRVPSGKNWRANKNEICAKNKQRINVKQYGCKKSGRYVGVQLTRDAHLTLCEVQVFVLG